MPRIYPVHSSKLGDPSDHCDEVTPGATALPFTTRGIYVGGTGNVEVITEREGTTAVFTAVPAGTILPVQATHVLSTNTTATSITALY